MGQLEKHQRGKPGCVPGCSAAKPQGQSALVGALAGPGRSGAALCHPIKNQLSTVAGAGALDQPAEQQGPALLLLHLRPLADHSC